ncbi:hypothetical protein HD597_003919 [Nonomuraea thailandensis]|uniref:Uncharacterized protein n=1 Tax=Nonomuraea thailandensis TaxID=1188745 RepID=A0A9X2GG60_9ACTN|nr:hypothetical protein [Nonomuraea thailandensis]
MSANIWNPRRPRPLAAPPCGRRGYEWAVGEKFAPRSLGLSDAVGNSTLMAYVFGSRRQWKITSMPSGSVRTSTAEYPSLTAPGRCKRVLTASRTSCRGHPMVMCPDSHAHTLIQSAQATAARTPFTLRRAGGHRPRPGARTAATAGRKMHPAALPSP